MPCAEAAAEEAAPASSTKQLGEIPGPIQQVAIAHSLVTLPVTLVIAWLSFRYIPTT